jgi:F0F1-type ATP synthase assembly protein I
MAFEMIIVISAGVFGGIKLDSVFHTKPLLTILFSIAGVALAMYFVLKGLSNTGK